MIAFFAGKNRIYSNFWDCLISYENLVFTSVENAFQAAKCKFEEDRPRFLEISAGSAKQLGQTVVMRDDWEKLIYIDELGVEAPLKVKIMYDLVYQKFSHEPLRSVLLMTGNEQIEEGNWHGDRYWGKVQGDGENWLGKIIMAIRSKLRIEFPVAACC